MVRTATVLVLIGSALSDYGESLTNLAGTVFHEVKVIRIEPDGINIDHSGGLAKIFFRELPRDIQLKYGYDPEAAAQHRQRALEARRARQAWQAQQAQQQAQAREQAADAMFPVDVFNIIAIKDRSIKRISGMRFVALEVETDEYSARYTESDVGGLYRVRFSLRNRTQSDLKVVVRFGYFEREVFLPAGSRREGEEISGDESRNEIFVNAGGQQKAFSVQWRHR